MALQPFAQVTKNDKVFIGGADCVYAEQMLVDAEEQMSFSVSALVGRQSVCYVYGGDVTLATQLATFFVSKYSGLSTTKFAAGVSTRAVIRIVNAATGDEVAIANANGEVVATFPVTVDGEASFVFRYDVAGEYSVFYKYAHSEASFATLETVTVAAVQSVYPYELVLGETRAFEFEGFALSSEDRYAVTEETECSATMESRPVTEAMQFSVAGNFSLCYYYAGVGFAVVKELLVREITYEGPTVFVNGVPDAVFGVRTDRGGHGAFRARRGLRGRRAGGGAVHGGHECDVACDVVPDFGVLQAGFAP